MRRERIIDEYLVAAARTGEARAFELLVERWHPRLIAHASRLTGHREGAQDTVQDAWVDIAKGLRNLRDDRAFPAWAYRITSRRCAAAIHALQRDRAVAEGLRAEPLADDPETPMEGADAAERLRAAIRTLAPAQRATIALFHFEELSVAEVAVALDVPTGTVKTRLMHARRRLRAVLEGEL